MSTTPYVRTNQNETSEQRSGAELIQALIKARDSTTVHAGRICGARTTMH